MRKVGEDDGIGFQVTSVGAIREVGGSQREVNGSQLKPVKARGKSWEVRGKSMALLFE